MSGAGGKTATVGETMVQFLEGTARRYGNRTAVLFKPGFRYQRWSYRDLWEGAGRVASLLQSEGLAKGDRVLIWGPNCPQWVLAFFGCLRAGVAVVPLDLRCLPDFARNVTVQTRPKLAFVSRLTPEAHQDLEVPEVYFEKLEELTNDLPEPRPVDVVPEDLAEIMFTSGTTGDPKGVMLTHRNLASNVDATSQHIAGKSSDRIMSFLPLSHMFEQLGGLFLVLRVGANVTYPSSRQPTVLARTMRDRRATTLLLVPQGLELIMNGIEREVSRQGKERLWRGLQKVAGYAPFGLRRLLFRRVHKQLGGSLRFIFSGGAALDPELGRKWELLGVRVAQGYGATEASPVISVHREEEPRYDSVGPPLPGVDVKISDDGEVLLRGPGITPGYWEAPEKTADAFQDGWYKTGDQGFLDDKRFLHLRGRKKDMIVLPSGQNVFPEDIELVLKKHEAVNDAAVVGLTGESAVVVHAALLIDSAGQAEEAVSWANKQLAEHQQIRGHTIWPEDDFPRTHTLKVKKALIVDSLSGRPATAPESQSPPSDGAVRGPRHIIAAVAGYPLSELTPEMTLGGDLNLDSLGRVELLSATEEDLGVYLDETAIDADTTVEAFTHLVEGGSKSPADMKFPSWGMSWWCRLIRGGLQRGLIFPILALTYRLRVTGTDNIRHLDGPVLFAANHNLPADNGLIIKAMRLERRRRLAIAGAAKLWRNPFWAVVNPLIGNGFPFSQEGAVRASLENLGRILDDGWSVLIYPEGKLTPGGPIQPFLGGTGLLAVEGKLPVVPLRLHIHALGSPLRFPVLPRGDIEIRFGEPLSFSPGTDYQEATNVIELAVKAL